MKSHWTDLFQAPAIFRCLAETPLCEIKKLKALDILPDDEQAIDEWSIADELIKNEHEN